MSERKRMPFSDSTVRNIVKPLRAPGRRTVIARDTPATVSSQAIIGPDPARLLLRQDHAPHAGEVETSRVGAVR